MCDKHIPKIFKKNCWKMTILTKPSAGAKQIPKVLNAESVENGAVIEQVFFFILFFPHSLSLSFSFHI